MVSLFADYIKELSGKSIVESEKGFATYYEIKNGMYIEDIYVVPEFRKESVASQMADQISEVARERGIKRLYGSVKVSNKNSTESLKVLLAYGFKLDSSAIDAILLMKEI